MTQNKPKSYNLILQIFLAPIIYAFVSIKLFPPTTIFVPLVMLICIIYYIFRKFKKRKKIGTVIKSFFVSFFTVILSLFFVRLFFAGVYYVNGPSMIPSLQDRDRIVADKTSYVFSEPARGDVILIEYKNVKDVHISRIVGLPGETLAIRQGKVYINNQPIQENYINRSVTSNEMNEQNFPPTFIPAEHYLVMGDNRTSNMDSREDWTITRTQIRAKITGRFYPFNQFAVFQSPKYKQK